MLNLTFLIALGSPQNPPDSELLAAFAALAAPQQQQVLRGVATRLQEVPGAGRIRKLAAAIGQPRQRPPRPWHHSAEFAPVAPSRTVIDRGSPRHDRVRAAFPVINQDRDGQPTWTYDWGCGRIVRSLPEPGPGSRFASLLAGRPAGRLGPLLRFLPFAAIFPNTSTC